MKFWGPIASVASARCLKLLLFNFILGDQKISSGLGRISSVNISEVAASCYGEVAVHSVTIKLLKYRMDLNKPRKLKGKSNKIFKII